MKPVMAWMKANLPIVILSVVIILILPLGFIGSSYWNGKIRKGREAAANKVMNDLNGLKVTYVIPSALPNGEAVTVNRDAPNPVLTNYFKEKREQLQQQVGQVVSIAEGINSKKPLIEGVFPESEPIKRLEFGYRIVGRQGQPSAYEQLLKSINAGGPADPTQLVQSLSEIRQQALEKVQSDTGRNQLEKEEQETLVKELASRRLGAYQQHANSISVYATTDVLPPEVPRTLPSEAPDINTCFRWQWEYWIIEDLLKAVEAANTRNGRRLGIPDATVKRIERMTLLPFTLAAPDPNASTSEPAGPTSITGRTTAGASGLYDIRGAELQLIVESARIPELINAISSTNFMTVTGLTIRDIDEWADLEQGYYYGTNHVVRVIIPIETIWLRSWTVPLMPTQVRELVTGAAAAPEIEAAPPPPPPQPVEQAQPAARKKSTKKSTKRPGSGKGMDDPF